LIATFLRGLSVQLNRQNIRRLIEIETEKQNVYFIQAFLIVHDFAVQKDVLPWNDAPPTGCIA